jgi:hypothetical protein
LFGTSKKASTDVPTYTAKAYFSYDSENYNAPDIDTTIDWEIVAPDRYGSFEIPSRIAEETETEEDI